MPAPLPPALGQVRTGRRGILIAAVAQTASSLTALMVNVSVARGATKGEFGQFGLIYASFLFIAAIIRSFLVEPKIVLLRSRPVERRDFALLPAAAASLSVVPTLIVLAALMASSRALPGVALVLGGLAIPLSIAQDGIKTYAIGAHRPGAALSSDGAWFVVQASALGLLWLGVIDLGPTAAIATWVLGAAFGIVAGALGVGVVPRLRGHLNYAWAARHTGLSWALDTALVNGAGQLMPWALVAVVSIEEVGGFRATMVLLGPTSVLLTAGRLVALPRLVETAPEQMIHQVWRWTRRLTVAALVAGAPLLVLPDRVGASLLGASWDAGRAALLPALAWRCIGTAGVVPLLALRALGDSRIVLRIRAWLSLTTTLAGLVGATVAGAKGVFIGMAIVNASALPFWLNGVAAGRLRATGHVDNEVRRDIHSNDPEAE